MAGSFKKAVSRTMRVKVRKGGVDRSPKISKYYRLAERKSGIRAEGFGEALALAGLTRTGALKVLVDLYRSQGSSREEAVRKANVVLKQQFDPAREGKVRGKQFIRG